MRFRIFDSYFLDVNLETHKISVISIKRRILKILKPTIRNGMSYYKLYENGIGREFSLENLISFSEKSDKSVLNINKEI